jgi:hypothetical protein
MVFLIDVNFLSLMMAVVSPEMDLLNTMMAWGPSEIYLPSMIPLAPQEMCLPISMIFLYPPEEKALLHSTMVLVPLQLALLGSVIVMAPTEMYRYLLNSVMILDISDKMILRSSMVSSVMLGFEKYFLDPSYVPMHFFEAAPGRAHAIKKP